MGKKNNNKSAPAAKAPPCKCEHPYNCDCGNRPERPSRGHKWDPVTQTWGGKGHKQKGAAGPGQATVVGKEIVETAKGGTKLNEWQKLPSALLSDWCSKNNAKCLPKFHPVIRGVNGKWKFRVIVPDSKAKGKKSDKDQFFVPGNEVSNEEQAKEEASLLALNGICGSLPHERKMPEPYKTTWLNLKEAEKAEKNNRCKLLAASSIAKSADTLSASSETKNTSHSKATSSSNLKAQSSFTSNAEKRAFHLEKKKMMNDRQRKRENREKANRDYEVFMSRSMRSVLEGVLRGEGCVDDDDDEISKNVDNDDGIDDDDDDEDTEPEVVSTVVDGLIEKGFSESLARRATKKIFSKHETMPASFIAEEALQWLCIHCDDDDLPEGFSSKNSGLDVVNSLPPPPQPKTKQQQPQKTDYKSVKLSFDELLKTNDISLSPSAVTTSSAENKEHADLEWESTEAIFGERCKRQFLGDDVVHISIRLEDSDWAKNVTLQFYFTNGKYPKQPPMCLLTFPPSFSHLRDSMNSEFLTGIYGGEKDGEVDVDAWSVFNVFTIATDIVSTERSTTQLKPPSQQTSVKAKPAATTASNLSATSSAKPVETKMRKVRRSPFWSTQPSDTSKCCAATPFPPSAAPLRSARERLPAFAARSEFLNLLNTNKNKMQVVLVTGETGCGKTTQIPQFILEEEPTAKIVVAQPRRIAATGVAERVANERGEYVGRGSVGYVVRGDTAVSGDTRLLFCTTGILLRQLQNENALNSLTHLVIDEVHERHLDTDVLLGILKALLSENSKIKLKVILMSATMDADRFAAYWGTNTPRMHIPGFTHPVQDYFLYEVLRLTNYVPPNPFKKKKKNGVSGGYKKNPAGGGGGRKSNRTAWDDSELSDLEGNSGDELNEDDEDKQSQGGRGPFDRISTVPLEELVQRVDDTRIDYDMVATLVKYLAHTNKPEDGSILVFLPGAGEIAQCERSINKITNYDSRLKILQLHGGLRAAEQRRVFDNFKGLFKVVLATNVAETSITIPDCVFVIDCCREKQSSYDPVNRMPLLLERFASQDSLKQRRGRAGRVRPGTCYKMITKKRFNMLSEHGEPEIRRCALDQTLLSLLFLKLDAGDGKFLRTLIDPPSQTAINSATQSLAMLGAVALTDGGGVNSKSQLTALGVHLAGIPAPPNVAKLIVMGSILGCRDASLCIAAGMSVGRSPFMKVMENRFRRGEPSAEDTINENILEERRKIAKTVGHSDHALLFSVYKKWNEIGNADKRRFCGKLGLSEQGMREMKQLRDQLDGSLRSAGFHDSKNSNRNGEKWRVVRSCVVSALSPAGLVRVERSSAKYDETMGGAVEKDGEARELKFFVPKGVKDASDNQEQQAEAQAAKSAFKQRSFNGVEIERVFVHPSSINFGVGRYHCPWVVFFSMVTTAKPYLRDLSECSGYGLLLLGGELEVSASEGKINVGGFARFSATPRIASLLRALREKLDELLSIKAANVDFAIEDEAVMKAVVKLLVNDGA